MSGENSLRDSGNLWVVVPFVLAVVGTVIMLFTNSANVLKVSLILALWAAAAGIIVIAKARRDRDEARLALEESDKRHEAELDAVRARGEADRAALALARSDDDIPVGVDVEVLHEIQQELKALRAQLEQMAGREFEYEPAALRAEARRIAELDAMPSRAPKPEAEAEPATVEPATVEPESEAGKPTAPSEEDTATLRAVPDAPKTSGTSTSTASTTSATGRPAGAPSSEAISGRLGTQPSSRAAQRNPLSQLISERQAGSSLWDSWESPREDKPAEEPAPPAPAQERRGGRRRRDERGSGAVSVAELLARRGKDAE
ncbi:DUF6779 domain-containing protein [Corynebacterium timonense]|uniref:DUF6779 domain-containing protein n=1 Tax=Corynebacterium timonense TaxID=441500 RepID=A0A1H1L4R6_9CORY|nr:DUF6779 domain-containing protein [Corynebacterium timonense]SDR69536.1 hypothetical protein SAMN04488539_0063 [Corynebacterium timonense]